MLQNVVHAALKTANGGDPALATSSYSAICAVARDENRFIREWAEYHTLCLGNRGRTRNEQAAAHTHIDTCNKAVILLLLYILLYIRGKIYIYYVIMQHDAWWPLFARTPPWKLLESTYIRMHAHMGGGTDIYRHCGLPYVHAAPRQQGLIGRRHSAEQQALALYICT